MSSIKDNFKKINKSYLTTACILMLILLAVLLLLFNEKNSLQSQNSIVLQVYFEGEYRIEDGEWQRIVEGEHIPATKGDVTLRGNLHMLAPDGEYIGIYRGDMPVAFYANHINLTFYEAGQEPFIDDIENPLYGDSLCGVNWAAHTFISDPEESIEILIHNPHRFGNETAIDEMLSSVALWSGIEFEKGVLDSGSIERNIGLVFAIVSIMILGIALFSSLIHIKNSGTLWLLGGLVLFAGIYFAYNSAGVEFWSESIVSNTTILGASLMLYMLFIAIITVSFMSVSRRIGIIVVTLLGVADAAFLTLPIVSNIFFYDMCTLWFAVQIIANIVIAICLVMELANRQKNQKLIYTLAFLPNVAFVVDAIGIWMGIWKGSAISQGIFTVLFLITIVMVLKLIPNNINAAVKAKELEMEKAMLNSQLSDSRISTMISQIRPHFIYNTLGSIEQLCKLDPSMAGDLVHNFAKYLRGNFGELDNPNPILMSQEMEHVKHYISIEKVRFPDMTFTFEMSSEDFNIPALTVQPIVENAIKHGLMKLPKGGTIKVVSYDTETDHCISVVDDGVGFDTNALIDERKHLGLRNIRERLKVMLNGTLEIESTVGVGTKVLIKIPKEAQR